VTSQAKQIPVLDDEEEDIQNCAYFIWQLTISIMAQNIFNLMEILDSISI